MLKLCIFDMDGTVVDTISSISYFANRALNLYGLPSIDKERYKILVGNGARVLVERMIAEVNGNAEQLEKVYKEYNTTYDNDFLYLTEAYEGVIEMLSALKEMGVKTAILSNKPDVTAGKVSKALFKEGLIDVCYGARDGIALKPDPAGVYDILEEMGAKKEECLYIGDTATDIKTAKNASLTSIGVLWGFRSRAELEGAGADFIIEHPSEIVKIAKEFK
ncbi:MAG: HAD family hydrolase [Ruminococcaceae bacterium]|nr:HAD family hydrolase [Oscillospiraceae bacterium]